MIYNMNEREESSYLYHIEKVLLNPEHVASPKEQEILKRLCSSLTGDQKVLLDVYMDLYSERQNEITKEMFLIGTRNPFRQ